MSHDAEQEISAHLIHDALQHVISSRNFANSDRKKCFLKFIVQETLAGRSDRIKAYTIAVDIFGRSPSFDPTADPLVRIEAGRMRRCLEHYYLTEGASDRVQITVPKGGYVPHFSLRTEAKSLVAPVMADERMNAGRMPAVIPTPAVFDQAPAALASSSPLPHKPLRLGGRLPIVRLLLAILLAVTLIGAAVLFLLLEPQETEKGRIIAERGPTLIVLPFENDSGDPAQTIYARGTTEAVIGALILFKNIFVLGADSSFRFQTQKVLRDAIPGVRVDYVLKGSINRMDSRIVINVALLRAEDHQYLWSGSFRQEFNPGNMIDLQQDIAMQVARIVVQPHGVIDKAELRSNAGRPPDALSSYECILQTREYWRQPNAKQHKQVRACLEQAIRMDPNYADAWAALAFIYTDEIRVDFNPNAERPDPAGSALELARRAVALAPDSPLPLQAVAIAHWLRREPYLSIAAYEHARTLNPHDSDILADLGRAYSLTGDWDRGIPLIREAFERNPAQPSWYRMFIAIFHYMHGRYPEALEEARKIGTPDLVYTHVILAMIYGQIGSKDEANYEVNEILRLYPDFGEKAMFEFERRNIAPAIIVGMVDGLRKAGLDVSSHEEAANQKD
ncbi:hypothetical protein N825_28670 [Skermanella stibiiresistens SB22]|uniref:Adenylate cyclase n=1 Tax=Skermanella stibiiresistens SB22 TaxID=1385369 RepID=W9GQZ7_9PROT|nr:tetratricopeptide repeat protein [Skermanella stibiiresistens]EWY36320.1 hypothetical protein N825_28670 [Skermanella stibiiresistens SB22]